MKLITGKVFNEKAFFYFLVLVGLTPLFFTEYFLTLDGASHVYNGEIIRELLWGRYPVFSELFRLNSFPVPNWISHFLFALLGLVFKGNISEIIVLAGYLVMFPILYRKVVLWAKPGNHAFSYLGVLFAHNHLLYFGFYNFIIGIIFLFASIIFITRTSTTFKPGSVVVLSLLFLLIYFSHLFVLLVAFSVAILLPFTSVKIEKKVNQRASIDWKSAQKKITLVCISMLPALILTLFYLANINSLESAGHPDKATLFRWIVDIRPLLPLCYCADREYFTHGLSLLFMLMLLSGLYVIFKNKFWNRDIKRELKTFVPQWLIWFLLLVAYTVLFFVVPDSNLLPDRLIVLVFVFFCFWISGMDYPHWIHRTTIFVILIIHLSFMFYHTKTMRRTSKEVAQMIEATSFVEAGSLLLPFNFAADDEWRHSHSSGYLGSNRAIAVIENYEAQLKWFPVSWNTNAKYELTSISTWGADNKKLIQNYFINPQNQNVFSLPEMDGTIQEIPYVLIFGRISIDSNSDFDRIKSILEKSYSLTYKNEFCQLYRLSNDSIN